MCESEQPGEKAAGTPMIRPLPVASSLERLTLFPGESSKRSTSGIGSPTLTYSKINLSYAIHATACSLCLPFLRQMN